jgi:hypothetical protein
MDGRKEGRKEGRNERTKLREMKDGWEGGNDEVREQ